MEADTDTNKLLQKAVHFTFHSLLDQRDKELCNLNPGDRKRNQWFHATFVTMLLNEGNADPSLEGKYDYHNVKGLSKNIPGKSIFKLGKIFIPINIGQMHWVCTMVNMVKKKIYMYDSMGGSGMSYLKRASFSTSKTNMWPRIMVLHSLISTNGRLLANHCMSKSQIRKMVSCCFFHYASGWTVIGCVL
jgi:hypothetical protein